jgi:hypothetical protein
MNAQIKNFLTITLKNAVNAILINSGLMVMMHSVFNKYSKDGLWNLGKATIVVIVTREVMVWGPILLQWSSTSSNPAAIRTQQGGLLVPGPKAHVIPTPAPPAPPNVKRP